MINISRKIIKTNKIGNYKNYKPSLPSIPENKKENEIFSFVENIISSLAGFVFIGGPFMF